MARTPDLGVAVVGAGPHGLAVANYLRKAGADVHVFGRTMESWLTHMPAGMRLRSRRRSSHIAAPEMALGIDEWIADTGSSPAEPLRLEEFYAYGHWYQERAVPVVDGRSVSEISIVPEGFSLRLDGGGTVTAGRVVVAAGIAPFAYVPEFLRGLPEGLLSHPADHQDLGRFEGRSVLVLGAGQSALESAALLKEAGAHPTLLARARQVNWLPPHELPGERASLDARMLPPTDVGGRVSGWAAALPGVCRHLSDERRDWVRARCMPPLGADWLRPRLREVRFLLGREIAAAEPDGGRLAVELDDGSRLTPDHLLACTGYRIDVAEYGFLSAEILARLDVFGGFPRLGPGLESSLAGLHFAGAPAAGSFGPIMRFVVGSWYSAPAIAGRVTGKRQRPAHVAYRPRHRRARTT
jgi:pyridine nucleotide-disulfide oxidoreductase